MTAGDYPTWITQNRQKEIRTPIVSWPHVLRRENSDCIARGGGRR